MTLYRSQRLKKIDKQQPLQHLGAQLAAAHRLKSKFVAQEERSVDDSESMLIYKNGRPVGEVTYENVLNEFCECKQAS